MCDHKSISLWIIYQIQPGVFFFNCTNVLLIHFRSSFLFSFSNREHEESTTPHSDRTVTSNSEMTRTSTRRSCTSLSLLARWTFAKQIWYIRFHKKFLCATWRTKIERLKHPFGKHEEKYIKHLAINYLNSWKLCF